MRNHSHAAPLPFGRVTDVGQQASGGVVRASLVALCLGCVGVPVDEAPAVGTARLSAPVELVASPAALGFRAEASGWGCAPAALRVRGDVDGTVTVAAGARGGVAFGTVSAVAPRVKVDADGALSMDRNGVVERWRPGADGVEQSWTFDRAPAGGVTVRVRFAGARYDGPSEGGLRFVDAEGSALHYGAATWVDARGERTAVIERVEGDAVVLTVPGDVVARSAFPAVLDPTISAEVAVDPVPLYVQSRTIVGRASIASSGAGQLAVWQDDRAIHGVYAARISAAGAVLDPANLLLAPYGTGPVVASDGAGYLVAWKGTFDEIYWSRVDASGAMLDPGGVSRAGSLRGGALALAFDGTRYVLAWSTPGTSAPYGIQVARIGRDGALLDPTGVVVSSGSAVRRSPAIASNAAGSLVAWEDLRDGASPRVYAARVTPAGVVSDPDGRVVSLAAANQTVPSVATDGTSFLVGWYALMGSGSRSPGPYAALVGPSGATLSIEALWPTPGTDRGEAPVAVAFSGDRYLATWTGGTPVTAPGVSYLLPRLYAVRVGASGNLLDAAPRTPQRIDAITPPYYPNLTQSSAVARAGGFRLLWVLRDGLAPYLRSVATDLDAAPTDAPVTVETAPVDQILPQVAASASGYLVGWMDAGPYLPQSSFTPRAVRLSSAGSPLDAPFDLSPLEYSGPDNPFALRLAAFGTSYLIGWSRPVSPALLMRPVPVSGAPGAVAPSTEGTIRALAAARTNALGLVSGGARRFGPDGRALDAFPIALPSLAEAGVASDGTNYLVYGTITPPACGATSRCPRIATVRLNSAGDLLDASPVPLAASAQQSPSNGRYEPGAASDGTRYLLTWRGSGLGGANLEIAAARVGADGVALDAAPIVVSSAASAKQSPSAAHDGASWVVAWGDSRDGNSAYAARVSAAGAALDPAGVAVATGLNELPAVRVASTGDGRSAVVYSRRATVATPVSARLLVRMLSFGDAGTPDAGTPDAGMTDAGVIVADSGVADVGTTDGGAPDVAPVDAGGVSDASAVGASADAGAQDVVTADVPTAPPPEDGGLCDVGGAPGARGARGAWAFAALGLVGLARRRRR